MVENAHAGAIGALEVDFGRGRQPGGGRGDFNKTQGRGERRSSWSGWRSCTALFECRRTEPETLGHARDGQHGTQRDGVIPKRLWNTCTGRGTALAPVGKSICSLGQFVLRMGLGHGLHRHPPSHLVCFCLRMTIDRRKLRFTQAHRQHTSGRSPRRYVRCSRG